MCIRVGLDWRCGHKWRGWKPCRYGRENDRIGELCPHTDLDQWEGGHFSPVLEEESTRAIRDGWFLKPDWCCSPYCCRRAFAEVENFVRSTETQYNDTSVANEQGRKSHYQSILNSKAKYNRVLDLHYDTKSCCVAHFTQGLGKLNTMR